MKIKHEQDLEISPAEKILQIRLDGVPLMCPA